MTPREALQAIGLNAKEAAVYLACLELGQATVTDIAQKASLKRPTTYLVLDALRQRGLLSTATRGKRTVYGVEAPGKLLGMIAERERALKTVLPYLEAINNRQPSKPRIRFYEGREGILRIYEEMFQAKEMRFWGSMEAIRKDFNDVIEWFIQISNTKKPTTFDLLTDTAADRAYAARVVRPGYQIRFFPPEFSLTVDSMIVGDKLSINAFHPEPHGLIVESAAITSSFRSLWELAWRGATPYRVPSRRKG